jgi:hypothetical protein
LAKSAQCGEDVGQSGGYDGHGDGELADVCEVMMDESDYEISMVF